MSAVLDTEWPLIRVERIERHNDPAAFECLQSRCPNMSTYKVSILGDTRVEAGYEWTLACPLHLAGRVDHLIRLAQQAEEAYA